MFSSATRLRRSCLSIPCTCGIVLGVPSVPSVMQLRQKVQGWLHREPKVVVPRTILVVDGNIASRESTARLVESLGISAVQAASLAEALAQLHDHDPEFVLLGFELDDATGLDALRNIRDLDSDLPVVMLAPDPWDRRVADAIRRGANARVARPVGHDHPREPVLGAALAGHVALLALAWLGVRAGHVSRRALVVALVASAAIQSLVALGQFTLQQTLVPPELRLPWLPSDPSGGGTPVVLSPAGDRLLRGFGTFPHPNILGGYLALALACLPVLTQGWWRRSMLWWLVGVVLVAGLLASFSRAAWLAALAGLGLWWWTGPRQGRAGWSLR